MTEPAEPATTKPRAWQPLTPRGVAAFAYATWGRLLLVQFIFALLAAGTVVWVLRTAWFPTVRQAIKNLPDQGENISGKLNWHDNSPLLLAESHFLAFDVDTNHSGALRSPAQIQVEFGQDDIRFYSLAGYRDWSYPVELNFGFNRTAVAPWWGAWEPPILWLSLGGTLAWCFLSWILLATIYFIPAWLGGYFANRELNPWQCWKLAGAALMPGALLMIAAIFFYGFGVLDLVQLAAVAGVHVIVGWVYTFLSVRAVPKLSSQSATEKNPFANKEALEK
jgi:hypothetical protein